MPFAPLFLRLAPVPDPSQNESPDRIKVVLADDHAAMRRTLRTLLDGEGDVEVVGETDSLDAVVSHVHARRPDVLVLDLRLSERGTGLQTLAELHGQLPDVRIVALTASDDPAFVRGALGGGALGVVLKEMADSDLPFAVRAACRGERYVSPTLDTRLAGESQTLTPRENEVLRLIALGYTSVEIAEQLGLSPRTIETHRARIHRKLRLASRAELVRYALRRGMLQV
jgi:two-component system, NarL family, response regulator NreC